MRAALVTIYLTSEFFNTNLLVINRGMSGKCWALICDAERLSRSTFEN